MTIITRLIQKFGTFYQRGAAALRRYGFRVFLYKVSQIVLSRLISITRRIFRAQLSTLAALRPALSYSDWINKNEPTEEHLTRQRVVSNDFLYRPKISIILPVYNTPLPFLIDLFRSISTQTYDHWELCISNGSPENKDLAAELEKYAQSDVRIRILHLEQNLGISENSNQALTIATGEYIALLDHDDTLSPFALYEVVALLQDYPELDLIYSDHDYLSTDGKTRLRPLFKPDWSPEIMLSANYITHLTVLRTDIVRDIHGFDPLTDGAQDWDLFFRVLSRTNKVAHIPKILYHWRETPQSTANNPDAKPYAASAQLVAITRHLELQGLTQVKSFFDPQGGIRVEWAFTQEKVSIIILARGVNQYLKNCIASILKKTNYPEYEILIINNGPKRPESFPFFAEISNNERIRVLHYEGEFNYSRVNNFAVTHATGKYILLLNDDTEVISNDWLDEMVMWSSRPEIGAVGAKLLRPSGLIQHAGVIVGMGGFAGHIFADTPENSSGIFGSTNWYRDYSALTAACLMIRKDVYDKLGGLSETFLLNGNDVEFGLRLREAGYRLVYNPFAVLKHIESATHQGKIPDRDFRTSFIYYKNILADGDPFFNPNLSYWSSLPTFRSKSDRSPLQFVDEHLVGMSSAKRKKAPLISDYSKEAANITQWFDAGYKDIDQSRKVHDDFPGQLDIQNLSWFIPEFHNAYYGGIFTILRFAEYFYTAKGITSQFLLTGSTDVKNIQKRIGEAFPALSQSPVIAVFPDDDWKRVQATDAVVSTLWTTAYYALRFNKTKRKFYFIQDYEPLFYPAGSIYGQVEATYRFGFFGLINTPGLHEVYKTQYEGVAENFFPNVDVNLFFPDADRKSPSPQNHFTVFFYGRPEHPRNAFELGAAALKKLKQKMGDRLTIISAGADWDPAFYGLENIVLNLGLLTISETAALYRTCDVGLGMMFTKHPSYLPFEFMASGCMVVSNKNAATSWFLQDDFNCMLTDATPACIAETLEEALLNTRKRKQIIKNARQMILDQFSDWDSQMEKIYRFMQNPQNN